jgi:hypothetical protein
MTLLGPHGMFQCGTGLGERWLGNMDGWIVQRDRLWWAGIGVLREESEWISGRSCDETSVIILE